MFGKKVRDMNAIEKYHHKDLKSITNRGLIVFVGVLFLKELLEFPESISNFNFEKRMYISIAMISLLNAIYLDTNKFFETRQRKSFLSTFICIAVILFNIGMYFYLID